MTHRCKCGYKTWNLGCWISHRMDCNMMKVWVFPGCLTVKIPYAIGKYPEIEVGNGRDYKTEKMKMTRVDTARFIKLYRKKLSEALGC